MAIWTILNFGIYPWPLKKKGPCRWTVPQSGVFNPLLIIHNLHEMCEKDM